MLLVPNEDFWWQMFHFDFEVMAACMLPVTKVVQAEWMEMGNYLANGKPN